MRNASVGYVVFAVTMIALGILGLIKGDYVSLWNPLPHGVPALPYVCALICLVCGLGLLWQRTAAAAARLLLAYLLLWLLLLRVPGIVRASNVETWWAASQIAAMAAATWVVYISFATAWDKRRLVFAVGERGLWIARMLYGAALIPFGVAHFIYPKPTAALVPGWLPWHMAWTYFTGSAFIAAGVSVLTSVYARLAAALSTLQIGLFTLLVWAPLVTTGSKNAFQWSETIISAALTVAAWVVAESYRRSVCSRPCSHISEGVALQNADLERIASKKTFQ